MQPPLPPALQYAISEDQDLIVIAEKTQVGWEFAILEGLMPWLLEM